MLTGLLAAAYLSINTWPYSTRSPSRLFSMKNDKRRVVLTESINSRLVGSSKVIFQVPNAVTAHQVDLGAGNLGGFATSRPLGGLLHWAKIRMA